MDRVYNTPHPTTGVVREQGAEFIPGGYAEKMYKALQALKKKDEEAKKKNDVKPKKKS